MQSNNNYAILCIIIGIIFTITFIIFNPNLWGTLFGIFCVVIGTLYVNSIKKRRYLTADDDITFDKSTDKNFKDLD